jgi:hypothetical protein
MLAAALDAIFDVALKLGETLERFAGRTQRTSTSRTGA